MLCVGMDTPNFQHENNIAASVGDKKSIPALKIYILWDIADLMTYLVPIQFQESIFPS